MFFEYRKYIYGIGAALLIMIAFVFGRMTINASSDEIAAVEQEVKQHDNVNQTLEVKGKDCLLKYEIQELNIIDNKLSFVFKINSSECDNVAIAKVMIKDQKNQVLEENPVESNQDDTTSKIRYELDLSKNNIEEAHIVVYAISADTVNSTEKINLEEAPFNKSVININLLKQEMIDKLKS